MLRLMITPTVKANLLVYGLVPLGLAVVSAGLAELEAMFADRTKTLAELDEQIAGREHALRNWHVVDVEHLDEDQDDVVPDAELVQAERR